MTNKFIVVTGGTKGIGRAILKKFLSQNFDVATCARNGDNLKELLSWSREHYPNQSVHTFQADLSLSEEADAFADYINSLGKNVDILVNNSGYFIPGQLISEPADTLDKMIAANLMSAYHVTKGLIPGMLKRRAGYIFNMCSVASIMAYPNGGSYAISKAALLSFSRGLREELKETGIRVTAVLPGATLTDSWASSGLPEERFMTAEDIADSVFLAFSLSDRTVVEELLLRPLKGDI